MVLSKPLPFVESLSHAVPTLNVQVDHLCQSTSFIPTACRRSTRSSSHCPDVDDSVRWGEFWLVHRKGVHGVSPLTSHNCATPVLAKNKSKVGLLEAVQPDDDFEGVRIVATPGCSAKLSWSIQSIFSRFGSSLRLATGSVVLTTRPPSRRHCHSTWTTSSKQSDAM